MKKISLLFVFIMLCVLLTGCACEHEWTDASCTAPKTCTLCGETEGEALGHEWVEADCVTAKTCAVCGETEGEALGHEWTESTSIDIMAETETTTRQCERCQEENEVAVEPLEALHRDGHFLFSGEELLEKMNYSSNMWVRMGWQEEVLDYNGAFAVSDPTLFISGAQFSLYAWDLDDTEADIGMDSRNISALSCPVFLSDLEKDKTLVGTFMMLWSGIIDTLIPGEDNGEEIFDIVWEDGHCSANGLTFATFASEKDGFIALNISVG